MVQHPGLMQFQYLEVSIYLSCTVLSFPTHPTYHSHLKKLTQPAILLANQPRSSDEIQVMFFNCHCKGFISKRKLLLLLYMLYTGQSFSIFSQKNLYFSFIDVSHFRLMPNMYRWVSQSFVGYLLETRLSE